MKTMAQKTETLEVKAETPEVEPETYETKLQKTIRKNVQKVKEEKPLENKADFSKNEATETPKVEEKKEETPKKEEAPKETEVKFPVSISKKDLEKIKTVPKDIQEIIAKRVDEQDKALNDSKMSLAKLQKEHEKAAKKIESIQSLKEPMQKLDSIVRQIKSSNPNVDVDVPTYLKGLVNFDEEYIKNPKNAIQKLAEQKGLKIKFDDDSDFDDAIYSKQIAEMQAKSEADYYKQQLEDFKRQQKTEQERQLFEQQQTSVSSTIEQFKANKPAHEVQTIMVDNEELLANVVTSLKAQNPNLQPMELLEKAYQAAKLTLIPNISPTKKYTSHSSGVPEQREIKPGTIREVVIQNLKKHSY